MKLFKLFFILGSLAFYGCGENDGPSLLESPSIDSPSTDGPIFEKYGDLPVGILGAASVQIGNKFYIIGGQLDENLDGVSDEYTAKIFESTVNSAGNPGAFSESSWHLASGRAYASAVIIGSYIYVIGGSNGGPPGMGSVERASIDSNGIVGNFSTYSSSLVLARYQFSVLLTNGYVYVIGGWADDPEERYYHFVERATVNQTTGDIGSFSLLTRTIVDASTSTGGLRIKRGSHAGIRLGDSYYVIGGEGSDSATSLSTIEKISINSDGTLGNFTVLDNILPVPRNRLAVFNMNNNLYVIGGYGTDFLDTIESTPIVSNEIGTWSTLPNVNLFKAMESGSALSTEQGIFYFGGYNHDGGIQSLIQKASLN